MKDLSINFECPGCNEKSISLFSKMRCSEIFPEKCNCGSRYYPHSVLNGIFGAVEVTILTLLGAIAMLIPELVIILLVAFLFLILEFLRAMFIPLVSVNSTKKDH